MTGVAVVIEPPLVYTAIIHEQKRLIKCGGSLFRLLCLVDASPSAHRLRRRLPRLGVDVPRHPVRGGDAAATAHGGREVRDLGADPAAFYKEDGRELQERFAFYPEALQARRDFFKELEQKQTQLLDQIKTERRGR